EDVDVGRHLEQTFDIGPLAEIGLDGARIELLRQWLEHIGPPAGQDQAGPACRERARHGLTQAPGGARDQGGAAFEIHAPKSLMPALAPPVPRRCDGHGRARAPVAGRGRTHRCAAILTSMSGAPQPKADPAASGDPRHRSARVIAIFGPTGVGKTDVAIALARELRDRGDDPVAISADALAVYAGLDIITGVPTLAQRDALEHRLVSFVPLAESFSAGRYAELAPAEIDSLLNQGRTPLVVGGTGLYVRAALAQLDLRPAPPREMRERWQRRLEEDGSEALHAELASRAPWAAEGIGPRDGQRLIRALELDELGALEPRAG